MTKLDARLHDRYELGDALSHSAWLALDTRTGEQCVVKELTLGRVSDWKQIDLFEREANTLRQLQHPGIPEYVDSFQTDEDAPRFYLVQAFFDGDSLSDLVEAGPLSEEEVVSAAKGLLEILTYLQSFSPPVLHRDITPSNILRRPDGSLALVDFGSVQVELRGTTGGSTIVGTSGYMAPEQLMGRAVPASDVYSLGMTLIETMSGHPPDHLPMVRMKPRWRHHAEAYSDRLVDIVDRMVEPNHEHRFEDASAVLRALGGETGAMTHADQGFLATRPADTDITMERTAKRLKVEIPARGPDLAHGIRILLTSGLFALGLISIVVGLTLPVWSFGVVALIVLCFAYSNRPKRRAAAELEVDVDRGYRVRSSDTADRLRAGPFAELLTADRGYGRQRSSIYLATTMELFEIEGLAEKERDWLVDEIDDFVRAHRRGS